MIDIINSRVIVAIAAMTITGLVVSMSMASIINCSKSLAENIAEEISELISHVSEIETDEFTTLFFLQDGTSFADAKVTIRCQSVSVSVNGYHAIRILEIRVLLIDDNRSVDVLIVDNESPGLKIDSVKDPLSKINKVMISILEYASFNLQSY